jgi:hypothetical protein
VAVGGLHCVTDTTAYSSLFEVRRNKNNNNTHEYGTIQTITTEAMSESPPFTRTEGSAAAASLMVDLAQKHSMESNVKFPRDRRTSETPVVDLSRVAEEPDESGSSGRGGRTMTRQKREGGGRRCLLFGWAKVNGQMTLSTLRKPTAKHGPYPASHLLPIKSRANAVIVCEIGQTLTASSASGSMTSPDLLQGHGQDQPKHGVSRPRTCK